MKAKIGFIGQGWIGKNYADDFEERGMELYDMTIMGLRKTKI
jgi:3-hydroxyisobutyrate dehydrogenase-like beta-hydroxyacid dehydrogenase